MKTKSILLVGVLFIANAASAANLRISGTVPDRGFNFGINHNELVPQENSNLKIYVSGKKLKKKTMFSESSFVRVEAP